MNLTNSPNSFNEFIVMPPKQQHIDCSNTTMQRRNIQIFVERTTGLRWVTNLAKRLIYVIKGVVCQKAARWLLVGAAISISCWRRSDLYRQCCYLSSQTNTNRGKARQYWIASVRMMTMFHRSARLIFIFRVAKVMKFTIRDRRQDCI